MTENPLKIVFFGTSNFAVPALKNLINFGHKIEAIITQLEKPAGRLRITAPSPVKKIALENNIPILEPHNLKNNEELLKHFRKLAPDICIVVSYGKILPSQFLEIPRYGFINIHPSLLPKYRGPSPIQTAVLNGDKKTGVSILMVDSQVDHGAVLSQVEHIIEDAKYYPEIEQDLAKIGAELLIDTLPRYINGQIKPTEQDHSQATFTKMLDRQDGKINWNKSAEEIYNQIRALNPEPGAWTTWKNKIINIKTADVLTSQVETLSEEGMVVKINNKIAVATKKCYLILKRIQLEGKKEMDVVSFLNGHPDFLSSKLE